jgi:hypothetical protein
MANMLRKRVFILALIATPALAEPLKLKGPEITELLSEQSLFTGDVEQIFRRSGQTVYIDHGNVSQGTWFVEADLYCSRWPPANAAACYDVTRDGNVVTFISRSGATYPMHLKY